MSPPRLATRIDCAPSAAAHAATFAAWPPAVTRVDGASVVPVGQRLLEPDDEIEHQISEAADLHRRIVAWTRRSGEAECATVLLGGVLGASAVIAAARAAGGPARDGPALAAGARRLRGRALLPRDRRARGGRGTSPVAGVKRADILGPLRAGRRLRRLSAEEGVFMSHASARKWWILFASLAALSALLLAQGAGAAGRQAGNFTLSVQFSGNGAGNVFQMLRPRPGNAAGDQLHESGSACGATSAARASPSERPRSRSSGCRRPPRPAPSSSAGRCFRPPHRRSTVARRPSAMSR